MAIKFFASYKPRADHTLH